MPRIVPSESEQPMRVESSDNRPREIVPTADLLGPPADAMHPALLHNVPAALSSFVGRTREVTEVSAMLRAHRALTLVGAGGAGKTRLAREVAEQLVAAEDPRYPDGVWWVELAPLRAGADAGAALATVLNVSPTAGRRLIDALADAVRTQRLLIVLDNCEHVIDDVARLVDFLLRQSPGVSMLCTSREPLVIDGEVAWPVPPLARPPMSSSAGPPVGAASAASYDAVQLFVERAQAAATTFQLTDANAEAVSIICSRLDGLPLALELAAAVVPVLGVDKIVARLDDALSLLSRGKRTALPRHRTLRAVLDWSYELLTDEEQSLLRRLSVFCGSFTLDAIEAVCVEGNTDIIPVLGRLVEHSLIDVREESGEARYRLLETVRQYGSALLSESADHHAVRRRHAEWVTRLAVSAEPLTFSAARGRTVVAMQQTIDEIRAALAWTSGPAGDPTLGVQLAGALGWFWISGVPWEEARTIVTATLAAADAQAIPDDARPIADRIALAQLHYPIEGLAFFAGDTDTMLSASTRNLAILDSIDDVAALSRADRLSISRSRTLALQLAGLAYAMRGDGPRAITMMDACIATVAASDDPWLLAVMMMRRALVHFYVGNHDSAKHDYDASIPQLRAVGESWFLSLALEGMAMNAVAMNDLAGAARHARDSVLVLREEPDGWFISRSLDTMAYVLLAGAGNAANAAAPLSHDAAASALRLLSAAESLRRRCGAGILGADIPRQERMHAAIVATLGQDTFDAAFAEPGAFPVTDAFRLAEEYLDASSGSTPEREQARRDLQAGSAVGSRSAPSFDGHVVQMHVLGPFSIERDGVPVAGDELPVGKVRELLVFLMLHEQATKDEVGLALWPESSPAQVRNAFHVTLHRLRRQLGNERWIAFERDRYRLNREPSADTRMDIDIDRLHVWSTRLRQATRRHTALDAAALSEARDVLESVRGELAQGLVADDWLVVHQDRARVAWAEGMDALAQQLARGGAHRDVLAVCERLVTREPLRESTHRLIMSSLIALGEPGRAIAHYDALVAMLQREVGARPSAETRALLDSIRR